MKLPESTRRAALRGLGGLAVLGTVGLGGCVVAPVGPPVYSSRPGPRPPPPTYGRDDRYEGDLVAEPPPPPRYEVVGIAPFLGALWFAGFWVWASGRWAWRPGYWGPPRAGYRWVPHAWIRVGPGWRARPGRWSRY